MMRPNSFVFIFITKIGGGGVPPRSGSLGIGFRLVRVGATFRWAEVFEIWIQRIGRTQQMRGPPEGVPYER